MDQVIGGELGGADLARALALLEGNAAGADAAAIRENLDDVFASPEKILEILEERSPAQRHAIAQQFARAEGAPHQELSAEEVMLSKLASRFFGDQIARARNLLAAGQAQSIQDADAFELQALKDGLKNDMDGLGTNEARLFKRLEKATPRQSRALLDDQALVSRLEQELSQEQFDRWQRPAH